MGSVFGRRFGQPGQKRLRSAGRLLADLVFPDKCLKCGIYIRQDPSRPLSSCYCRVCMGKSLPRFVSPFCPCCGHLFSSRAGDDHLCDACMKKRPPVGRVRAAFEYTGLIREAVALFKYQGRMRLAAPFEYYLFEAFLTYFADRDVHVILPVPLHRKKAAARGFNQAYILVRRFGKLFRRKYGKPPAWRVDTRSLVRIRHTPSQTGLDINARRRNLRLAFAWRGIENLDGCSVLLVDDVFTTGATCHSAAGILKGAGAGRVDALVLARA